MIKVLQYGEGNFLRTFVDLYFDTLNKSNKGEYLVNVVKPISFGSLERFEKQNNKYHAVLRGQKDGKRVEEVFKVDCLQSVIDPFKDYQKYIALAQERQLKIIISNTTEAGICYNENDKFDAFDGITYPAKLTKFLYQRFCAGLEGVYILPVELIDNNADELKRCVDKYIELFNLPSEFKDWNDNCNFYCNTLVDRIVSGYPRDEKTKEHLQNLIGETDELLSIGEPFGLWVVEDKGDISKYIVEGVNNIEVVLTKDIGYYKKRKVRVLNGSHTNLVPVGLILGAVTVYDCMIDEKLSAFVQNTLNEEIIPFVSADVDATTQFASSVKDRFMNEFLNHQLISISLNSISKWKARVLPSFKDYYAKNGKIAPNITIGFSYLLALYSSIKKVGETYRAEIANRSFEIKDDLPYLQYFSADNASIGAFMANKEVWGEDLTQYNNFLNEVEENVEKIKKGVCLI